jgi:hypothetical protein
MRESSAKNARRKSELNRILIASRKRLLSSLENGEPTKSAQSILESRKGLKYLGEKYDPTSEKQTIVFEQRNGVLVEYNVYSEVYMAKLRQRYPRLENRRFPRLEKGHDGKTRFPRSVK